MIDEDAERRRQITAAAMGETLAKINDVVVQLRADLARARAEAESFRLQLLGEREVRIDREAEISRLRAAACLRTPEDISDALTTAHGQGQEDAIATVAGWLGCAPKIGAIEAAIAAREVPYRPGLPAAAGATSMHSLAADGHCTRCLLPAALISTPYGCCAHAALTVPPDIGYRPGLPTVEQVRAHEARCPRAGGWTTWQRQYPGNAANIVLLIAVAGAIWVADGGSRRRLTASACQWRPCLLDGTPCPWID